MVGVSIDEESFVRRRFSRCSSHALLLVFDHLIEDRVLETTEGGKCCLENTASDVESDEVVRERWVVKRHLYWEFDSFVEYCCY
jgi:hypothetical protein